jgi:hypothetical protein
VFCRLIRSDKHNPLVQYLEAGYRQGSFASSCLRLTSAGLGGTTMLTRRTFMTTGAAAVTAPVATRRSDAAMRANMIVMGKGIDDIVALRSAAGL